MKVDEFFKTCGITNNNLLTDQEVSNFLEHFGIMGMKWGVRNSTKAQNRREQKALDYETKAKGFQKQIDDLNKKEIPTTPFGRNKLAIDKNQLAIEKDTALKAAEAKRQGKLTQKQKSILKGATAAAAVLAVYGTYNSLQSGQAHSLAIRGKSFLSGNGIKTWAKKPELATKDLTADAIMNSVVRPINPEFGAFGTKMNCRRATFAYEMRRRGYDVAATRTTNARGGDLAGLHNVLNTETRGIVGSGQFAGYYQLAKEKVKKGVGLAKDTPFTTARTESLKGSLHFGKELIDRPNTDSIFEALSKNPTGARGELGVTFPMGGGHSLAWEKIKGKIHIFDTQNSTMYKDSDSFYKDYGGNIDTAAYTRLDNVNLNETFLTRWLKDA